jgi:phosphatidylglycerophosphate synthase
MGTEAASMHEHERIMSLRASIAKTVGLYFVLQCAAFSAFALPGGFMAAYGLRFLCASAGFHLCLYILLDCFRNDFRKEATGEKLAKINLANRITLIRVSAMPTLLFLVVAAKTYRIRYPLLAFVVAIFITDFLDGYVSRRANEVTKAGRMLDSASDYCLIVVLTLVFRYYRLIPIWFLVLVLIRLGIQVVLMATLIAVKRRVEPKTTPMGKIAVASIMVAYSFEVLGLITGTFPPAAKAGIEWLAAAIVAASIGDKIKSFAASLNETEPERRISNGDDKERP